MSFSSPVGRINCSAQQVSTICPHLFHSRSLNQPTQMQMSVSVQRLTLSSNPDLQFSEFYMQQVLSSFDHFLAATYHTVMFMVDK